MKSYDDMPDIDSALTAALTAERGIDRAAAVASLAARSPMPDWAPRTLSLLVCNDPDPRVRSAALGALVRPAVQELNPGASRAAWEQALSDIDPGVRRRACEDAPKLKSVVDVYPVAALLNDSEPGVVEAAAWALGELGDNAIRGGATSMLMQVARAHPDPLARESAVAALGALGDASGLPAILDACGDKPAIRRRAVLALAPFNGPEVDAALDRALNDTDWQVRQAAEDLRETPDGPLGPSGTN